MIKNIVNSCRKGHTGRLYCKKNGKLYVRVGADGRYQFETG